MKQPSTYCAQRPQLVGEQAGGGPAPTDMSVKCYAQRLLNPFRGAMHVIRYASAEAVTTDGVHWDIYVSNDALRADLPEDCQVQTSDLRYGSWSAAEGLKRGPINLYDDFLAMEAMGALVFEQLKELHTRVPFGYADRFELWLLDTAGQPLALLASACSDREMLEVRTEPRWQVGYLARERFTSTALPAEAAVTAADYLCDYINGRAGPKPQMQWFERQADGAGQGLCLADTPESLANRHLPASAFPRFILAEAGHDEQHRRLIDDYHAWLAPWLLLLPGLSADTRAELERKARAQPLEVARQYRLYPAVVNQAELNAALVESVLLNSQARRQSAEDMPLPIFYIELNPGGGG